MKRCVTFLAIALFLGVMPLSVSIAGQGKPILMGGKVSADQEAGGDITVTSDLIVEKGVTLTIKKGSSVMFKGGQIEVYGTLIAKGTPDLPIKFAGVVKGRKKISGIRIINSREKRSEILNCTFKNLGTAVYVSNSIALIEGSLFEDNDIAIDAKQRDETVIKGNTITKSKKVGIFIKSDSKAKVIGNKISGIKKYGIYIYRSGGADVKNNEIKSCGHGIMIAYVGSDAKIEGNKLTSNKVGIMVEKGANPELTLNTVFNNRHGIEVSKRSDPVIKHNDIEGNKAGIFITYSSYPVIEENNLIDNEHSIYLEFQSAQWEKERGKEMERGGKKPAGGKKMGGAFSSSQPSESIKPRENISDKVYAQKNFWGDDVTEEMMESDSRNISAIYDYFDAMEFVEDGKKYKLDSVDYIPWANEKFEHKR
jgi:parallel beta-helix repeat protein